MASNPIQRRARQAFLVGFLIALVIMAVVVVMLFGRINKLDEENKKLKIKGETITVYTITKDIDANEQITAEDLVPTSMTLDATSHAIDTTNYITPDIFNAISEDEFDENGEPLAVTRTLKAKVDLIAGIAITENMLYDDDIANDERLIQYNMISLPTTMVNGDYIDVRLQLANGTDFVVLSKKKVQSCTASSVWLKMSEMEILMINGAIIDSYLSTGSKLYALQYTNPGMQEAATVTYYPSNDIIAIMNADKNIMTAAINELALRMKTVSNSNVGEDSVATRRIIEENYPAGNDYSGTIEGMVQEEITDIATNRNEYVANLEGTGMVGTDY